MTTRVTRCALAALIFVASAVPFLATLEIPGRARERARP